MENHNSNSNVSFNLSANSISQPKNVEIFVRFASQISEIFSLILLVAGCICSPLSIAVFSRKPFRTTPMSLYLSFVALYDLIALVNGLIRKMENYNSNSNVSFNISANSISQPKNVEIFVRFASQISEIFSLILLVAGCICSPLSIAVFSRKPFRTTPMSLYLSFVALYDLIALVNGLISIFRLSVSGRNIFNNVNICRLYYWTVSVFSECSSWTLIAVTVERVISIIWPHRVKVICSLSVSKVTILVIFLTFGVILTFIPTLVGHVTTVNPTTNKTFTRICVMAHITEEGILAKNIFDVVVFATLPFSILAICNIIIIASVIESRKRVLKFSKKNKNGTNVQKFVEKFDNVKRKNAKIFRSKRETSLTITLICINFSYIMCNLPVVAYQLSPHGQGKEGMSPVHYTIFTLLYLLMYFNNVLNFILYFITGSKFRTEFRKMVSEGITCFSPQKCWSNS